MTNQWFDYTTQPARVNLRVGLRGGVSPIVFDGGGIDYASIGMNGPTGGFVDYDAAGDKNGTRGMGAKIKDFLSRDEKNRGGEIMQGGMPPDEVWARSEFLYPLAAHQGSVQRASYASGPRRLRPGSHLAGPL